KSMGQRLPDALLAPLPALGRAWRLGPLNLIRLSFNGLSTPAAFANRHFRTEAARRVIPGLALHVDLGPDDLAGAGLGLVLGLLAPAGGFPVPLGGARAIAQALIRRLEEAGGQLRAGQRVERIVVRGKRAVAVRVGGGEEIAVRRAILADVGPPALYDRLL